MKTIKHLILSIFLLTTAYVQAQEVQEVIQKYKEAIEHIDIIHCQVEQLDTFVTGTVWNHHGQLTMMRKEGDELFGFQYKAFKGVGGEALYDGISAFEIDHEKQSYELNTNPQEYILGSPGGQLVIQGLMNYQDPEITPELIESDQHFILWYTYPDLEEYDVYKREKRIFLDKATFLPAKMVARQESLGKKQVMTRMISNLQINRAEDQETFQKDFLNTYKMVKEDEEEDMHEDLLNTRVKEFELETFAGKSISTQPKTSKLLLLDFWEVWCGPCVQSMPKVQALADKYTEQGLEVIGVIMDPNSQDSAERLIKKKGIAFTQAIGHQELKEYFRVYAIPQYVLIDQDGTIQDIFLGYNNKIEKQIKKHLAKAN
ncbi:MAG: TlpA disulfide reductase family protein [Bacteroidota bacterium]